MIYTELANTKRIKMTTSTTGVTWTTPVTISPYSVRVSDGPAISYNPVKDLFVVAYVDASTAKINTMASADLSSWNSQPGHESQLAIGSPAISCSGSEERCTIAYTDLSDGARLKYIEDLLQQEIFRRGLSHCSQ